jgi:hypothetical protein
MKKENHLPGSPWRRWIVTEQQFERLIEALNSINVSIQEVERSLNDLGDKLKG